MSTPIARPLINLLFATSISVVLIIGCSGGSTTSTASTTTTTATTTSLYPAAYKSATWGSTVTVTYPSACTMTLVTTGKPDYTPNAYYLAPAGTGQTVVAYTSATNTALAVVSYATTIAPALKGSTVTLNTCPTPATSTTATSGGAIGYLLSGTAMFNPFEMNGTTPAVADNASYTFTDTSGVSQTAYFLDQCNSHSSGTTWHAHGNPNCVTSQVDTASGPSHIIGIALDGYPIYGGRDINGNVVTTSQLDSCNGITSPTPEFPNGAYHYVLPLGVTTKYASINCYTGTVSATTIAQAKKLACDMKTMFAMIEKNQSIPIRKKENSPMNMGDMVMPAGSM
jgi:hypothetical protein